jgi:uncharacterized membrane protein
VTAVVGVVAALVYPAAVYFGLTRGASARAVSLVLLGMAAVMLVARLRRATRDDLLAILPAPLAAAACGIAGAVLDDARFVMAVPVLISGVLLVGFAASLRRPPSLIERFARMQEPDLSPEKVAHCRTVTQVWCAFFVVNGSVAAALAVAAPLEGWALYAGVNSYLLMGVLFEGAWMVRAVRFPG